MADALLSVVLQRLTSAIETGIQQETSLLFGGQQEAEKLATTLTAIRAVLTDAEKKQVKESLVHVWLEELKAISYDLDDVLDEWNTRIYGPKLEKKLQKSMVPKKKIVSFSSLLSPCFCFNQTVMHRDIGLKMKSVKERLSVIANEKDKFQFAMDGRSEDLERVETTPLIDVKEVCGRDLDKHALISRLCDSVQEESGPVIVSVVGMGGMGKTTLAQLAFNDERVSAHFEHKIWVCVSEPFDKTHIAKSIIEAVDVLRSSIFWSDLQKQLSRCIEGKRFLLVLDDVRTDDFRMWEPIKIPLQSGGLGSRILVTTRNERVSRMMEANFVLPLGKLLPNDSWSLFSRLAFYGKSRQDSENLEGIGRRIADRCQGLPLALKTLGSLMRLKETKQAWKNVLDSELWELEEVEKGIFAPLLLSYYDLSPPLKQCFTYCAIFPKDYEIEKNILIQQWMAQGFLVATGSVEMEQKGEEYFDNLVMRSFLQDLKIDGKITCKMHDIVHDFAQFLAKTECLIIKVDGKNMSTWDNLYKKARHLTVMGQMEQFNPSIFSLRNLRTLQVLQENMRTVPHDLFHCMTSLRELDLSHTSISRLPVEVGKLLHLRHLNLSSLNLEDLPDTLCTLYNLQTLDLYCCRRLQRLPRGLRKLIYLRHLILKETECLSMLPAGIGKLSCLRTLCRFIVSENGEGCSITELKNLNHLRGHLEISGLNNVMVIDEVKEANLMNKEHLESLDLVFSFGVNEVMEKVIEALQPHPNLERLQVYDYGGSCLPSWITLMTNLKELRLLSCANCQELPPLGTLPSLEKLLIGHFNKLKYIGPEFLGLDPATINRDGVDSFIPFPKLKELTFRFMVEWEKWDIMPSASPANTVGSTGCSSSNATLTTSRTMPHLCSLSFYDCPKLIALPTEPKLMQPGELIIVRCPILEQQRSSHSLQLTSPA